MPFTVIVGDRPEGARNLSGSALVLAMKFQQAGTELVHIRDNAGRLYSVTEFRAVAARQRNRSKPF